MVIRNSGRQRKSRDVSVYLCYCKFTSGLSYIIVFFHEIVDNDMRCFCFLFINRLIDKINISGTFYFCFTCSAEQKGKSAIWSKIAQFWMLKKSLVFTQFFFQERSVFLISTYLDIKSIFN